MSLVKVEENDLEEMRHIAMRRQELESRLQVLQEMKKVLNQRKSLTATVNEGEDQGISELEKVKTELQLLSDREKELLNKEGFITEHPSEYNYIISDHPNRVCILPTVTPGNAQSSSGPGGSEEVVEVHNLSLSPAPVRCPSCLQHVTTTVHRRVGSTTFFLCCLLMLLCCVGGCCLLPFCVNYFKDACHTCPSCQAEICTISRI